MNQDYLKLFNICNNSIVFQGSSQNITEYIVAMLANKKQKLKPDANLSTSHDSNPDTKKRVKFPPFARYFNQTSDPESQK